MNILKFRPALQYIHFYGANPHVRAGPKAAKLMNRFPNHGSSYRGNGSPCFFSSSSLHLHLFISISSSSSHSFSFSSHLSASLFVCISFSLSLSSSFSVDLSLPKKMKNYITIINLMLTTVYCILYPS